MNQDMQFKVNSCIATAYLVLFGAAGLAVFVDLAAAIVPVAISVVLTILAMRIRCPECRGPLLKTEAGWWAPYTPAHCRACGHDLRHQHVKPSVGLTTTIYRLLCGFFFFGFVVVAYHLVQGEGTQNEMIAMFFFAVLLFAFSIYLMASTARDSLFLHRLGYLSGLVAFTLAATLAVFAAIFGAISKAVLLALFIGGFYLDAKYRDKP